MTDNPDVKRYLALGGMAPLDSGSGKGIFVTSTDHEAAMSRDSQRASLWKGNYLAVNDQIETLEAERDALLGLLREVQADLLRRGEKDSEGCTVVNLGNRLWCRIDAALAKLGGES